MNFFLGKLRERINNVSIVELKHLESTIPDIAEDETVLSTLPVELRKVLFVSCEFETELENELRSAVIDVIESKGKKPESVDNVLDSIPESKMGKIELKYEQNKFIERYFWMEVRSTVPIEAIPETYDYAIRKGWKIVTNDQSSQGESPLKEVLGETLPGLYG